MKVCFALIISLNIHLSLPDPVPSSDDFPVTSDAWLLEAYPASGEEDGVSSAEQYHDENQPSSREPPHPDAVLAATTEGWEKYCVVTIGRDIGIFPSQ
jgi:hypothetical protein